MDNKAKIEDNLIVKGLIIMSIVGVLLFWITIIYMYGKEDNIVDRLYDEGLIMEGEYYTENIGKYLTTGDSTLAENGITLEDIVVYTNQDNPLKGYTGDIEEHKKKVNNIVYTPDGTSYYKDTVLFMEILFKPEVKVSRESFIRVTKGDVSNAQKKALEGVLKGDGLTTTQRVFITQYYLDVLKGKGYLGEDKYKKELELLVTGEYKQILDTIYKINQKDKLSTYDKLVIKKVTKVLGSYTGYLEGKESRDKLVELKQVSNIY